MKISKKQLRQIIKEELTNESYDAQSEIYDITQHLSDASMKLGEFSSFLRGSDERRAGQFDSLSRQVAKINKSVETHIPAIEGGLREDANAEQARLQQGASSRRFEQDLDALIDEALASGIPSQTIAEILQMFAGSV
tara:strand:- start:1269 stop:1679 length:411 start_codon:yes stop_codon:yes gene_type:complete